MLTSCAAPSVKYAEDMISICRGEYVPVAARFQGETHYIFQRVNGKSVQQFLPVNVDH